MTTPLTLRRQMVDSQLRARGIANPRVLDAMLRVPRHEFVPEPYRAESYDDHPLPIGDNQTISQPYVVAVMLEALDVTLNDAVLEIGTGSGYVTALLAELAAQVFSVERHLALAGNARQVLAALGYTNVRVFSGDGTLGLSAVAPFNAILVSAAAPPRARAPSRPWPRAPRRSRGIFGSAVPPARRRTTGDRRSSPASD